MKNKSNYNPALHHRRSIRLKGYDYSQEGLYFITLCCQDKLHRFGKVINGEMVLNEFGKIAHENWLKTPEIRPQVELGAFVIMPNHMHGIIQIKFSRRGELNSPPNECEKHSFNKNNSKENNSPKIESKKHSFHNCSTGELHSPPNECEKHSFNKNNSKENNSPKIESNKHSFQNYKSKKYNSFNPYSDPNAPDFWGQYPTDQDMGEFHSPIDEGDSKSPMPSSTGELHSPSEGCELHSPKEGSELHSPSEGGELNSPPENSEFHSLSHNSNSLSLIAGGDFKSPQQTIGSIIRGYKSAVTKQTKELGLIGKLWQRDYYEHIIRDEIAHQRITNYILQNPSNWNSKKSK